MEKAAWDTEERWLGDDEEAAEICEVTWTRKRRSATWFRWSKRAAMRAVDHEIVTVVAKEKRTQGAREASVQERQ